MGKLKKFRPRYTEGALSLTEPDFSEINAGRDKRMEQNADIYNIIGGIVGGFNPAIGATIQDGIGKHLGEERIRGSNKTRRQRNSAITDAIQESKSVNAANSIQIGNPNEQPIAEEGLSVSKSDKNVEVEKDELVFRKIRGRYKLIMDLNKGKKHEDGGEDVTLQGGDVIFPGSKRKMLIGMLDSNGFVSKEKEPKFNTERSRLPSDKDADKARRGLAVVNEEEANKRKVNLGEEGGENFNADNFLTGVATVAPVISNIIRGAQKPEAVRRRFVTPEKVGFVDVSQLQKNDAEKIFRQNIKNVTNLSGGNTGVALSNLQSTGNQLSENLQEIEANKQKQLQEVENFNTQLRREANRINTDLNISFDDKESQNKAARNSFTAEGLSQISDVAQRRQVNKRLEERDNKMIGLENLKLFLSGTQNYSLSEENIKAIQEGRYEDFDPKGVTFNNDNRFKEKDKVGNKTVSLDQGTFKTTPSHKRTFILQ